MKIDSRKRFILTAVLSALIFAGVSLPSSVALADYNGCGCEGYICEHVLTRPEPGPSDEATQAYEELRELMEDLEAQGFDISEIDFESPDPGPSGAED